MAIIKRKKDKETLLKRAHLGTVDNAEDIINLALQNGIRTTPLDLPSLYDLLGIKIIYSHSLEKDMSGNLRKDDDVWVCSVNANHHPTRQRFTLAHELAHYILHRNEHSEFLDYTYFRQGDDSNSMEYEADAFAGNLLMPQDAFTFYIESISSDINSIAEHFHVSPLAVRVRAKQLNLKEVS